MIITNEIRIKLKSKCEVYRLLATEGNIYLPPQKKVNHYYLSIVISSKTNVILQFSVIFKQYVKASDVKLIRVPRIKGLTVSEILPFAR